MFEIRYLFICCLFIYFYLLLLIYIYIYLKNTLLFFCGSCSFRALDLVEPTPKLLGTQYAPQSLSGTSPLVMEV